MSWSKQLLFSKFLGVSLFDQTTDEFLHGCQISFLAGASLQDQDRSHPSLEDWICFCIDAEPSFQTTMCSLRIQQCSQPLHSLAALVKMSTRNTVPWKHGLLPALTARTSMLHMKDDIGFDARLSERESGSDPSRRAMNGFGQLFPSEGDKISI